MKGDDIGVLELSQDADLPYDVVPSEPSSTDRISSFLDKFSSEQLLCTSLDYFSDFGVLSPVGRRNLLKENK